MPLLPVAVYGLEVPCTGEPVPALVDFPATFRITMAAIDPSEPAEVEDAPNGTTRARATLKIIRQTGDFDDDDDEDSEGDSEDEEYMRALLAASDSDDEESDEEEANGGPSDPSKSKKARKQAALEQLMESIKEAGDSDEEMEDAANGVVKAEKGKAKATGDDEDSSDSDDDDEGIEVEEFVLCTLDLEKNYQQTLDITVGENERVFFSVTGTHSIFLTGNYVMPDDDGHNHHHEVYDSSDDENDEDYDLSPDEDELELELDEDESDELDALENPRITEVDSDEEAPTLVAATKAEKKGKNKRSADEIDGDASLDDIMAKSLKPEAAEEPKLTKKQKKQKKNNGEAAPVGTPESKGGEAKEISSAKSDKSDKKVQFAKNLEQGPSGSEASAKGNKTALGVKTVNGVKIDDKKLGAGPAVKNGDKVGVRYIGKLLDGKVFDSNKSGKPFEFKVGKKEVIPGWDTGVLGMSVGGERRLTIPPKLAYGSKNLPGLPANSTLNFDIKLIKIS
ncbi:FK506-binding protein [Lachnellula suecica]|uniref:peptidylprolyl isomerase n=1 Tax=Lachnellula suecica TaxID=602035 RepID=A0A8T9CE27_9HELO|nr:FK506-binding protein [Lachnellula suecica]